MAKDMKLLRKYYDFTISQSMQMAALTILLFPTACDSKEMHAALDTYLNATQNLISTLENELGIPAEERID